MEIEYKKIINQKMGKEAKARGFKMVSLSPGITKWPIAIFKKSVDGHSQKYDINLDLVYNKVIFRCGKNTIEKKYEDEESYTNIILECAKFMNETGFKMLDEKIANEPGFRVEDHRRILEGYQKLADEFVNKNNIDETIAFGDRIYLIVSKINELKNKDWGSIKEELLLIGAYYCATLLTYPDTRIGGLEAGMIRKPDRSTIYGPNGIVDPLFNVYNAWMKDEDESIKRSCADVMAKEEYEAFDWKF